MHTKKVNHTTAADIAQYLYTFLDLFCRLVDSITKDKQYIGDIYLNSYSKLTITANSSLSCYLCFSG